MTRMSVGEFKTNFSAALEIVKSGKEVEVLYGRAKQPIARLVPPERKQTGELLGCLESAASFTMSEDWNMTPEELLEL